MKQKPVLVIVDEMAQLGPHMKILENCMGVPVFVFHECADDDDRWMGAKPVFESIAAASGGGYCPFTAGCADALRELLSTVAVFSAAGQEGLKQIGQPLTAVARQLQSGLLLLPAPERES